ncbi:hypothetical protein HYH03_016032 [Edaphochlamys debaryana]|uniref:Guanylate cyclase domain-containing protein n=1 Tax=Edaphochlamys debaryana TaxID=47281 RepID=A0A836BQB6_9CHLO|nr:hypothetical protein HYH03_016032 [Edaphochlamys debaryana]|eukprot:KAG2485246.1 hypothetical protein HYH03_016032 [Edaphochlamys debaryana]
MNDDDAVERKWRNLCYYAAALPAWGAMGRPVLTSLLESPSTWARASQFASVVLCFTCAVTLLVMACVNTRLYRRWCFVMEAVYVYVAITLFVVHVHLLPLGGAIELFFQCLFHFLLPIFLGAPLVYTLVGSVVLVPTYALLEASMHWAAPGVSPAFVAARAAIVGLGPMAVAVVTHLAFVKDAHEGERLCELLQSCLGREQGPQGQEQQGPQGQRQAEFGAEMPAPSGDPGPDPGTEPAARASVSGRFGDWGSGDGTPSGCGGGRGVVGARTRAPRPLLRPLCCALQKAAQLERRLYAVSGVVDPQALLLAVLVPASAVAFVRQTAAFVAGGQDCSQRSKPMETLIAMTACFMLGTLEPHAVLHRQLGTAQALLYDLMPEHVARALLRTEMDRRRGVSTPYSAGGGGTGGTAGSGGCSRRISYHASHEGETHTLVRCSLDGDSTPATTSLASGSGALLRLEEGFDEEGLLDAPVPGVVAGTMQGVLAAKGQGTLGGARRSRSLDVSSGGRQAARAAEAGVFAGERGGVEGSAQLGGGGDRPAGGQAKGPREGDLGWRLDEQLRLLRSRPLAGTAPDAADVAAGSPGVANGKAVNGAGTSSDGAAPGASSVEAGVGLERRPGGPERLLRVLSDSQELAALSRADGGAGTSADGAAEAERGGEGELDLPVSRVLRSMCLGRVRASQSCTSLATVAEASSSAETLQPCRLGRTAGGSPGRRSAAHSPRSGRLGVPRSQDGRAGSGDSGGRLLDTVMRVSTMAAAQRAADRDRAAAAAAAAAGAAGGGGGLDGTAAEAERAASDAEQQGGMGVTGLIQSASEASLDSLGDDFLLTVSATATAAGEVGTASPGLVTPAVGSPGPGTGLAVSSPAGRMSSLLRRASLSAQRGMGLGLGLGAGVSNQLLTLLSGLGHAARVLAAAGLPDAAATVRSAAAAVEAAVGAQEGPGAGSVGLGGGVGAPPGAYRGASGTDLSQRMMGTQQDRNPRRAAPDSTPLFASPPTAPRADAGSAAGRVARSTSFTATATPDFARGSCPPLAPAPVRAATQGRSMAGRLGLRVSEAGTSSAALRMPGLSPPPHTRTVSGGLSLWTGGGGWAGLSGVNSPVPAGTSVGGGPTSAPPPLLPGTSGIAYAEWHDDTSLLFCDIQGFTSMSHRLPPSAVLDMLNTLYTRFDALAQRMQVYKVDTVGDCYIVATGLMRPDPQHADTMLRFARAMRSEARKVTVPGSTQAVKVRIGISSGRVMSGVVGSIRRKYSIFGDTANTASRMESLGEPGQIHVSCETYKAVQNVVPSDWICRGEIEVKGRGPMVTYFYRWSGRNPPPLSATAPALALAPTSQALSSTSTVMSVDEAALAQAMAQGPRLLDSPFTSPRVASVVLSAAPAAGST